MSNAETGELILLIREMLAEKERAAVGIDGRCGAGKTTLARLLAEEFSAPVVHTDDFFLPFDKRTPQRLSEPGGNLDRERFLIEALPFIGKGTEFSYGIFDCSAGRITGRRTIPASRLTVVEGSYSLHPSFGDPYDLRVFCDISPEKQLERLSAREGGVREFTEKWIPMEERYFAAFRIKESSDAVITAR